MPAPCHRRGRRVPLRVLRRGRLPPAGHRRPAGRTPRPDQRHLRARRLRREPQGRSLRSGQWTHVYVDRDTALPTAAAGRLPPAVRGAILARRARADTAPRGRVVRIRGAVLEEIGRPQPYALAADRRDASSSSTRPGPASCWSASRSPGCATRTCRSSTATGCARCRCCWATRPPGIVGGHRRRRRATASSSGQRVVMTFLPTLRAVRGVRDRRASPRASRAAPPTAPARCSAGSAGCTATAPTSTTTWASPGFATHAVVDARSVVPVDADVPADVAAVLGCAVLTGGGAILNAGQAARRADRGRGRAGRGRHGRGAHRAGAATTSRSSAST